MGGKLIFEQYWVSYYIKMGIFLHFLKYFKCLTLFCNFQCKGFAQLLLDLFLGIFSKFFLYFFGYVKIKTRYQTWKFPEQTKTSLVIWTKLNLAYFARLNWPRSFLAYASKNHKQNLHWFPRLIWGNYRPTPYHLRKF